LVQTDCIDIYVCFQPNIGYKQHLKTHLDYFYISPAVNNCPSSGGWSPFEAEIPDGDDNDPAVDPLALSGNSSFTYDGTTLSHGFRESGCSEGQLIYDHEDCEPVLKFNNLTDF
jgi:hypothetical protein